MKRFATPRIGIGDDLGWLGVSRDSPETPRGSCRGSRKKGDRIERAVAGDRDCDVARTPLATASPAGSLAREIERFPFRMKALRPAGRRGTASLQKDMRGPMGRRSIVAAVSWRGEKPEKSLKTRQFRVLSRDTSGVPRRGLPSQQSKRSVRG